MSKEKDDALVDLLFSLTLQTMDLALAVRAMKAGEETILQEALNEISTRNKELIANGTKLLGIIRESRNNG